MRSELLNRLPRRRQIFVDFNTTDFRVLHFLCPSSVIRRIQSFVAFMLCFQLLWQRWTTWTCTCCLESVMRFFFGHFLSLFTVLKCPGTGQWLPVSSRKLLWGWRSPLTPWKDTRWPEREKEMLNLQISKFSSFYSLFHVTCSIYHLKFALYNGTIKLVILLDSSLLWICFIGQMIESVPLYMALLINQSTGWLDLITEDLWRSMIIQIIHRFHR